ncbi:MAG: S8 family peptidase [Oscillospiraceae bacterium]
MKKISIVIIIIALLLASFATIAALAYNYEEPVEYDGYLVKLRQREGPNVRALGLGNISEVYSPEGLYYADSMEDVMGLINSGAVEYIEPDYKVKLFGTVEDTYCNDTFYFDQWNLHAIDVPSAWEEGFVADNVKVAVIDTGINAEHEEFENLHIAEGINVVERSTNVRDNYGHGSFVSGIIAAARNNGKGIAGLTDNVTLIPIKCFASSIETNASYVISAIYEAVDTYDCDVINLSLGLSTDMRAFREAVDYAAENGVLMIASVGNESTATVMYPAGYDNVVGVGSVGKDSKVSFFSQRNNSVFVVAPGEHLYSIGWEGPDVYKKEGQGTSFSTAHVTAMAAVAKYYRPDMTIDEFKELLKATSIDLGPEGYDKSYGYGLINTAEFMRHLNREYKYSFKDVEGTWAEESIYFCVDRGLFTGVSPTAFEPDTPMNRAMFITVLGRLSGDDVAGYASSFNDVSPGDWYYEYVGWGIEKGITMGKGSGLFAPYQNVTREQMAVFLYRYAEVYGLLDSEENSLPMGYEDAEDISDWAREAMSWAVRSGLINGRTDTELVPYGTATRAEVATILMRFIMNFYELKEGTGLN